MGLPPALLGAMATRVSRVLAVLLAAHRASSSSSSSSSQGDASSSVDGAAMIDQLQRVVFHNSGTTHKADRYSWQLIEPTGGQQFYYLEPQNVTSLHNKWGQWGEATTQPNSGRRYKFLLPPAGPPPPPPPPPPPQPPPRASCKVVSTTDAHDIPGHDGGEVQKLPSGQTVRTVGDCEAACCATTGCDGFVFTPSTPHAMGACTDLTAPCCFLKKQAVGAKQIPCAPFGNKTLGKECVAVTMTNPVAPPVPPSTGYIGTAPPSGIRSAVPLGGISCGTVELRGDGSFSEWTIVNQSPAGAAKIAEYEDAFTAVRLCGSGGCAARILQTHPHGSAATSGVAGVESLTYSGTHPVARLQPTDDGLAAAAPGLNVTLFAFASLVAGNMSASARPAAAFSLTLDNQGGSSTANASFLLNMPLQVENDQSRPGKALGAATAAANSSVCASQCEGGAGCLSWNFVRSTGMCQLQSNGPLNRYTPGTDSGVKGHWSADADGRCVTLTRPGKMPFSGEVSLCASPTPAGGGDSSTAAAPQVQLRPHTDVGGLLRDFARGSSLASSTESAQHGAIQVSATVAPGASTAITITFGWRFPHLDWFSYDCGSFAADDDPAATGRARGLDNGCYAAIADKPDNGWEYGNHYAEIYPTARAAAWNGAEAAELSKTLTDIDAIHSIFMTSSALPGWLQDHLVNSVSHARDSYWFSSCPTCAGQGCSHGCTVSNDTRVKNVIWRQFEANDCPDLDSIHNDGERHMPYITLWPDAERSKMAAWAHNQLQNGSDAGMLPEQIQNNEPDKPNGRRMGDGSSAGRKSPLATDNLLENTDGVPHQCSLGAAPCDLLVMLTRAILMPALFQRPSCSRCSSSTAAPTTPRHCSYTGLRSRGLCSGRSACQRPSRSPKAYRPAMTFWAFQRMSYRRTSPCSTLPPWLLAPSWRRLLGTTPLPTTAPSHETLPRPHSTCCSGTQPRAATMPDPRAAPRAEAAPLAWACSRTRSTHRCWPTRLGSGC